MKANNEGVFDWLIRERKKKLSQYFYDIEDKVDSKRDGMLCVVIVR
jgi:hypothetical protein